jgi:multiple sugar transport system substrate-binding protein
MAERGKAPGSSDGLVTRREILKRGILGAAGLAAVPAGLAVLPAVLAACAGTTPTPTASPLVSPPPAPTPPPLTPSPTPGLAGRLRVGIDRTYITDAQSNDLRAGLHDVDAAFAARTGLAVTENEFSRYGRDPYLTTEPDDVCLSTPVYHCGYVLQALGPAGLFSPLDDVWAAVKDNFSAAVAEAVTGHDGHVYGIPFDTNPWAFFYRKSLWASKGYDVPATWTELLALCKRMQSDGLTPIALGAREGWPPMGTFDMLNLRLNGYDFHIGLLTGQEKWTDERVIAVFETWRKLIPYYTNGLLSRTWQDAAGTLVGGKAGMFHIGLFSMDEFNTADTTVGDDIDFFEFPYFGNQWDAERAVEAPIDIWIMPSKSPTLQGDLANSRAYLDFWAKGSTQLLMCKHQPGFIPTARDSDTSQLDRLGKKAFELMDAANHLTQFFDRDTRPDFAGYGGMGSFMSAFLYDPTRDLAVFTLSIQRFWDALPSFTAGSLE